MDRLPLALGPQGDAVCNAGPTGTEKGVGGPLSVENEFNIKMC